MGKTSRKRHQRENLALVSPAKERDRLRLSILKGMHAKSLEFGDHPLCIVMHCQHFNIRAYKPYGLAACHGMVA